MTDRDPIESPEQQPFKNNSAVMEEVAFQSSLLALQAALVAASEETSRESPASPAPNIGQGAFVVKKHRKDS